MLLKTGMSIKQAFLCNLLSAALQLTGTIIGIAIGLSGTGDASGWLFAFAGGIFLYIGLVDMVRFTDYIYITRKRKKMMIKIGLCCSHERYIYHVKQVIGPFK